MDSFKKIILFFLFIALFFLAEMSKKGRYELSFYNNTAYIFDTQTADIWLLDQMSFWPQGRPTSLKRGQCLRFRPFKGKVELYPKAR